MLSGHLDVRRKLTWTNKAAVLLEGMGSGYMPAKGNEQARLVERKVCFVSDVTAEREGRSLSDSTLRQAGGESVHRLRRGAPCRDSTVSSDAHFQISHGGFVIFFVFSTIFSSKVRSFPCFRGQFLELWQHMSWLHPGDPVVNPPPGEEFSIYKTTHRIRLRIFFISLQEELEVLHYM